MSKFIPLSVPNLKGNEFRYIEAAVDAEWVSTGGAYITRFENEFANYCKVSDAVAVQSGTAALHLAMLECGVQRGDLVIAPTLTFMAAINPIRYVGADPVFMDCDDMLCMDMAKLERYLHEECYAREGRLYDKAQSRPVTAIVVVHIFGNMADMERLVDIAENYNLPIIEDATEAAGTFYTSGRFAGKMAGTIGDYGAYSFNGNKIITTGGGGMLVAKDIKKLAHMKHLSTQAKADELYYVHDEIGYNYRMTNLQAAMGIAQLEQLEGFIETKRRNYEHYRKMGLALLSFRDIIRSNHWFYSFASRERDGLIHHLSGAKIQARPIWKLNHLQAPYACCRAFEIDNAQKYYESIVNLPCSSNLSMVDVERVALTVSAFERINAK